MDSSSWIPTQRTAQESVRSSWAVGAGSVCGRPSSAPITSASVTRSGARASKCPPAGPRTLCTIPALRRVSKKLIQIGVGDFLALRDITTLDRPLAAPLREF